MSHETVALLLCSSLRTEPSQAKGGQAFFVDFSNADAICDSYARANPLDSEQARSASPLPTAPLPAVSTSTGVTTAFFASMDSPAAGSPQEGSLAEDAAKTCTGKAFFVSLDAAASSSPPLYRAQIPMLPRPLPGNRAGAAPSLWISLMLPLCLHAQHPKLRACVPQPTHCRPAVWRSPKPFPNQSANA